MATQFDPRWYKAWHTWALANFEVISHLESEVQSDEAIPSMVVTYVTAAVQGDYRVLMCIRFQSLI